MTNPTLTMHQLGMVNEPQGLTNHTRTRRRRPSAKTAVVPDGETVPKVGTVVDIDLDLVVFEDDAGTPKTPMTKLRFDSGTKKWQQLPANLAGLLAFFDADPPDGCKRVRVDRVIPSGRACYVVPA